MSNSIGDLKNSGLQGNNFPWQLKMLQGQQCACDYLREIDLNTDQVESLLVQILSAIQQGSDFEAFLVEDANGITWLEVRIWDPVPAPGAFLPPVYFVAGTNTPGTPALPITYINPNSYLAQIVSNTTGLATELTLTAINNKLVNGNDIGDVTVNNGAGAAAVNIQDGGNSITVDGTVSLSTTTLTALENITVQNGAGAAAVNIQDGGNTITVDAVDLDIRDLVCATDSVSICSDGTPVGSGNPLPVGVTFPSTLNVNVNDGVGTPITSTTIVSATGLDVNIIQTNVPNQIDSLEQTGVIGDLSAFGSNITSISFMSVGTVAASVSVNGGGTFFPVAPGTTINLSADGPTGFYSGTSFFWDTLTNVGSSLIIIYNYI
jgi:hypothetical protein